MNIAKHPCQWLFDHAADAGLTSKEMRLPVFEFLKPHDQREAQAFQRQSHEPYPEFWFTYRVNDRGIEHRAAMLVQEAGLRCWFPTVFTNPFGRASTHTLIHKTGVINNLARGMTDAQFFADYEDCMRALTERRERSFGSARLNGPGIPNGEKVPYTMIGDLAADRTSGQGGVGVEKAPHNRISHPRRLSNGRTITVTACKIHGGSDHGRHYKVCG